MTEDLSPEVVPDSELVEQVLAALDDGVASDVDALSEALSASEAEVRSALAAVHAYQAAVRAPRNTASNRLPETDASLPAGTTLGEYVVEGRIGAGAMGTVYRARQMSLGGRLVALKVLPRSLADRDPRFVERFRREASLAATIHHPNLAEVYSVPTSGDVLAFAMRLVEGRTLHDVLIELAQVRSGPVRTSSPAYVRRCVVLARGVTDALAAVHARGLVHRDVKPSNIILEGAGDGPERALECRPVLVDFGLLRPAGPTDLTGSRTLLGTPAYASHEVQLGRDVDARSDVFSVGALLHDLVTATSPGTRAPATSGLDDPKRVNPAVDARLSAVLHRSMLERRDLRYANAGALREELDRWLRGEPVHALPTRRLARLRMWARSNPMAATRAALLAVIAMLFVAISSGVLATAWQATALAKQAVTAEREGDLPEAARAYRALAARSGVGWIGWLGDDMDRARRYVSEGEAPFTAAIQLLQSGQGALDEPRQRQDAERAFARAADRLCNVLFGPDEPALGDVARRALLREARDGSPQFRRRIAMEAFANYLWVLGADRPVLPGFHEILRGCIAQPGVFAPETRQAATSALGAIPTVTAFAEIVELISDADPRVGNLARNIAVESYAWLHHFQADSQYLRIDDRLMIRWADQDAHWWESTPLEIRKKLGIEVESTTSSLPWQLACYAHPNGWARIVDGARSETTVRQVTEARAEIDEFLATNPDLNDDRDDADGATLLAAYRVATGRAVLLHDASIWRPPARFLVTPLAKALAPDLMARHGCIDFGHWERDTPPGLSGTVLAADCAGAVYRPDAFVGSGRIGHLRLRFPGYSALRLRTAVPPNTSSLMIRVQHLSGSRSMMRDGGYISARVSVDHHQLVTRVVAGSSVEGSFLVAVEERGEPRETEISIEFLHGNTTYWIRRVELDWTTK